MLPHTCHYFKIRVSITSIERDKDDWVKRMPMQAPNSVVRRVSFSIGMGKTVLVRNPLECYSRSCVDSIRLNIQVNPVKGF